jgi:hypothetical protein
MHTGQALERGGDWFGTTINIAARVSGIATGGEVLLTQATRAAAGNRDGIYLSERGRHPLKNIGEPVLLFAAVRDGERDDAGLAIDPAVWVAHRFLGSAESHDAVGFRGTLQRFAQLVRSSKEVAVREQHSGQRCQRHAAEQDIEQYQL